MSDRPSLNSNVKTPRYARMISPSQKVLRYAEMLEIDEADGDQLAALKLILGRGFPVSSNSNGPASGARRMTNPPTLLIYAKPPRIGHSKTRLAAGLSSAVTARRLASMTLSKTLRAASNGAWTTRLYLDPPDAGLGGMELGVPILSQGGGDLTDRLNKGLAEAPPGPVIFVGADAPKISAALIRKAVRLLQRNDAVFGPAEDGGFWLFGLNTSARTQSPFENVRWSTVDAMADVRANLPSSARVATLDTLIDLDDAADVEAWKADAVIPEPIEADAEPQAADSVEVPVLFEPDAELTAAIGEAELAEGTSLYGTDETSAELEIEKEPELTPDPEPDLTSEPEAEPEPIENTSAELVAKEEPGTEVEPAAAAPVEIVADPEPAPEPMPEQEPDPAPVAVADEPVAKADLPLIPEPGDIVPEPSAKPKKKPGFFARLFGKKAA